MQQAPTKLPAGGERLLIVQPWFTAKGHPAQSLFNTMRTLAGVAGIDYLVAHDPRFPHHADLPRSLGTGQRLFRFGVRSSSLLLNTAKGLLRVVKLAHASRDIRCVFFFDMHLVMVSLLWPLLAPTLNLRQLTLLYLTGPERICRHAPVRSLVRRLLRRREVVLCLRTEELEAAWQAAFADVAPARIRTLPSLEIPEGGSFPARPCHARPDLRFGILGQLRRGKSIETLVPFFLKSPEAGILKVAGSFNSPIEREALGFLQDHPAFEERYLEDEALLQLTAAQDYILVFYDHWDSRMESAVLYLAMRANRPVLAYADGWCGRMVRQFRCGITVVNGTLNCAKFFPTLPLPGSQGYGELLEGVGRFRAAHSGRALLPPFLERVGFASASHVNQPT